jgi:hypothetical protein
MSIRGRDIEINGLNLNVLVEGEDEPVRICWPASTTRRLWTGHMK